MMRSLYSAVSGLKTHQTRMDVIGNNIANVNTEAFKSSRVTFSEIMYQTTASASGGNAATGIGGINAKQIGLGVSTGATSIAITTAGAAETTGNPFDLKLTDSQTTNFFIVSNGASNFFTRSGSYYVDGNGFLCMTSTGYTLMGWQVDPATGDIKKDVVTPLQVMSAQNQTSNPEATTLAKASGILDKNDSNVKSSEEGYVMTLGFYDDLGYSYTARFNVKPVNTGNEGQDAGKYTVSLSDVMDEYGASIIDVANAGNNANNPITTDTLFSTNTLNIIYDENGNAVGYRNSQGQELTALNKANPIYYYTDDKGKRIVSQPDPNADTLVDISGRELTLLGADEEDYYYMGTDANNQQVQILSEPGMVQHQLIFDSNDGSFVSINGGDTVMLRMSEILSNFETPDGRMSNFQDIEIDFTACKNLNNGGTSTMNVLKGINGDGAGKKLGALTGLSVDSSGRIFGTYDNGNTVLLSQVAVAQFSNASGLEKIGDNCYQTTLNSGDFDGIGVEVSADGSAISTGELEMSNVDLSAQFTDMIITQRGFQANSRVITTSDTLLEELINLKR